MTEAWRPATVRIMATAEHTVVIPRPLDAADR